MSEADKLPNRLRKYFYEQLDRHNIDRARYKLRQLEEQYSYSKKFEIRRNFEKAERLLRRRVS